MFSFTKIHFIYLASDVYSFQGLLLLFKIFVRRFLKNLERKINLLRNIVYFFFFFSERVVLFPFKKNKIYCKWGNLFSIACVMYINTYICSYMCYYLYFLIFKEKTASRIKGQIWEWGDNRIFYYPFCACHSIFISCHLLVSLLSPWTLKFQIDNKPGHWTVNFLRADMVS